MVKDYCTGFFECWFQWYLDGYIPKLRKIYIGNICKKHDEHCSSHGFIEGLWSNKILFTLPIWLVASIACWVKYPSKMFRRI